MMRRKKNKNKTKTITFNITSPQTLHFRSAPTTTTTSATSSSTTVKNNQLSSHQVHQTEPTTLPDDLKVNFYMLIHDQRIYKLTL